MATVYYEFNDYAVLKKFKPAKYCYDFNWAYKTHHSNLNISIANVVWLEHDDGSVVYLKNRYGSNLLQVDMEKFFWVKMQSIKL